MTRKYRTRARAGSCTSVEVPERQAQPRGRLYVDADAAETVRLIARACGWTISEAVREMSRAFARERGWKVKGAAVKAVGEQAAP